MKKPIYIVLTVLALALIGILIYRTPQTAAPTGNTAGFDQSISDGKITVSFSSSDWGLATTKDQILVRSYIPPCDENFSYCLYYKSDKFKGTNFESAGIRIIQRADLSNERLCLSTPPQGFDSSVSNDGTVSKDDYTTSVFKNVGQGAAGHVSEGSLYRLFLRGSSSCYEFETRIGKSQYGNYPEGSIKEFTSDDRNILASEISEILRNISSGGKISFPGL